MFAGQGGILRSAWTGDPKSQNDQDCVYPSHCNFKYLVNFSCTGDMEYMCNFKLQKKKVFSMSV